MPDFTKITITGAFQYPGNNTHPGIGSAVAFELLDRLVNSTTGATVERYTTTAPLTVDGTISVVLDASNDPTTRDVRLYRVTPRIEGSGPSWESYLVLIPYDAPGGTIPLGLLIPAQPSPPSYWVLQGVVAAAPLTVGIAGGTATLGWNTTGRAVGDVVTLLSQAPDVVGFAPGGGGGALSNSNPLVDSTAAPGIAATASRGDHVHPLDTAPRAPAAHSASHAAAGSDPVTPAAIGASATGHTHTHGSTTGQGTDDHHPKSHGHTGADGSGTVAYSALTGKPTIPAAFIDLLDTLAGYTALGGQVVTVRADETGLETQVPAGLGIAFTDLIDAPTLFGQNGQVLGVVSNALGLVAPVLPADNLPQVESGSGQAGFGAAYSRSDHIHPQSAVIPSHAGSHITGGGDTIAGAVAGGAAGLMTGADKTKLNGIASGATVSSVGLSVPGVLFSVAGSPITGAGTLALSLLTQSPNTVLAGPASGGAATPTMRALVAADIPDLSAVYLPVARLTGGGVLATGGFTLTVPATGTAALVGVDNVFTVGQGIRTAHGTTADGLYVPFFPGDTHPTLVAGGSVSGNNQVALAGTSDSSVGVLGQSTSGNGVQALSTTGVPLIAVLSGTATAAIEGRYTGSGTGAITLLVLRDSTSGTGGATTGGVLSFLAKSDTVVSRNQMDLTASWGGSATDASRKARGVWTVYDTAAREILRGEASGTAPLLGFFGHAAAPVPTVSGAQNGNPALASMLAGLAGLGLITDSSTTGTAPVTSVALTLPADFSVSGSPVTGAGTLTVTRTTQSANTVQAGPSSGGAATPSYRALVAADVPAHAASHTRAGTDPLTEIAGGVMPIGYYTSPYTSTTSTRPDTTLLLSPLLVPRAVTLDAIGIEVTAASSANGVCRLGIYATNASGLPGALVLDAGTVVTTGVAVLSITISQVLAAGLYWLAAVGQGAPTPTAPTYRANNQAQSPYVMAATSAAAMTGGSAGDYVVTAACSGALPNPAGAAVAGSGLMQRVFIHVSA